MNNLKKRFQHLLETTGRSSSVFCLSLSILGFSVQFSEALTQMQAVALKYSRQGCALCVCTSQSLSVCLDTSLCTDNSRNSCERQCSPRWCSLRPAQSDSCTHPPPPCGKLDCFHLPSISGLVPVSQCLHSGLVSFSVLFLPARRHSHGILLHHFTSVLHLSLFITLLSSSSFC